MLVTTGGASVGDHDLVQAALTPKGIGSPSGRSPCGPGSR